MYHLHHRGSTAWLVFGALLAAALWPACDAAAAHGVGARPRRSAEYRRRYEDGTLHGTTGDRDEGDDGGGDDADPDVDVPELDGYAPYAQDDVRKRGAIARPYERKQPLRPTYANGLRVDPSLLRDEAVELPTYVNVPVTLRCKFVPLEDADNKFETVVEAMYPGHRNAPPPPPESHAAHVLGQLMGSVDGWRGAAGRPTRPVRRVPVDSWYGGWRAWPPVRDEPPAAAGGRWRATSDGGAQIAARLRAAERAQRFRLERGWYPQGQPEAQQPSRDLPFQPPRFERLPVGDRWTRNRLIDERVDDRQNEQVERQDEQVGDSQDEQVERQDELVERQDEQNVDDAEYEEPERFDGGRRPEIINGQQYERARQAEIINDQMNEQSRQAEIINDQLNEETQQGNDQQAEPLYESLQSQPLDVHQVEPVDGQRQVDSVQRVEDRTADNADDERRVPGSIDGRTASSADERNVPGSADDRTADIADERNVQEPAEYRTAGNADEPRPQGPAEDQHPMGPEITTVAGSDYASFTQDRPVRYFVENLITAAPT